MLIFRNTFFQEWKEDKGKGVYGNMPVTFKKLQISNTKERNDAAQRQSFHQSKRKIAVAGKKAD